MDQGWIRELFVEIGLEPEEADRVAKACFLRLLKREDAPGSGKRRSLLAHLVRDPMVSLNRIAGRGEEGLPFLDAESGRLSAAAFSHVMNEQGLDAVVSMAFAKVVTEAWEPQEFYQPVWEGLGHKGEVNLDDLRRSDWSPLRKQVPELADVTADEAATQQVRVKPRARRPGQDD